MAVAALDRTARTLQRLETRNRVVAILRIAMPALGAIVALGLVFQVVVSTFGPGFALAGLSIDRDNLVVSKPSYAGVGADGRTYRMTADEARVALDGSGAVLLKGVVGDYGTTGAMFHASAGDARMDMATQSLGVPGVTNLSSDEGLSGTLTGLTADLPHEAIAASGPVTLHFADGSTLTAQSMLRDPVTEIWHFEHAEVSLAATPGEDGK
jgi:hypothetical protein